MAGAYSKEINDLKELLKQFEQWDNAIEEAKSMESNKVDTKATQPKCNHIHRKGYVIRLTFNLIDGDDEFPVMVTRFYDQNPPSSFEISEAISDVFIDKDISEDEYYVSKVEVLDSEFVIKNK